MDNFWQTLKDIGMSFVQNTGLAIVRTIAFFVLGLIIVKIVQSIVRASTYKSRHLDQAASTFIVSIITVILYIALIIVLVSSLGFSTAGIIAAFSAVALAVALALKDSLASLANGVIIIFTKPFKKGDHVEINSIDGLVQDIRLFNTKIITYDNIEVIVPNSEILSSDMINYSTMPLRRVVIDVPLPYSVDTAQAKEIILTCASSYDNVVNLPAPSVILSEYGDSALKFSVRVWTKNESYSEVLNGLREKLFNTLRLNGLEMPYSRLEVTLLNESNSDRPNDLEEDAQ